MNLSTHFTLAEATFSQTGKDKGIDNAPTFEELRNIKEAALGMEHVRSILGNNGIRVSSWFRCVKLNKAVGGSPTSAHVQGYAIDFTCPKFGTPKEICIALKKAGIKVDQLIQEYHSWVHISFEPRMRDQYLTASKINGKTVYKNGIL